MKSFTYFTSMRWNLSLSLVVTSLVVVILSNRSAAQSVDVAIIQELREIKRQLSQLMVNSMNSLIISSPSRHCPPLFRRYLLEQINNRRENGPKLTYNSSLAFDAQRLVDKQRTLSKAEYSHHFSQHWQYVTGKVLHESAGDKPEWINLDGFKFYDDWRGQPVSVSKSKGNVSASERLITSEEWRSSTQVGFGCIVRPVNPLGEHHFWVGALFAHS